MDNQELTTCNRCSGDACLKTRVNENITTYFCWGCGFQTNTLMTEGSKFFLEQIDLLPEIYKILSYKDKDGLLWVPTFINNDNGMIYANGVDGENWSWCAVNKVPIEEGEEEKFANPSGGFYKTKPDMSTSKYFPPEDFMDSLSHIGTFNLN